jgi:hypothetical protein
LTGVQLTVITKLGPHYQSFFVILNNNNSNLLPVTEDIEELDAGIGGGAAEAEHTDGRLLLHDTLKESLLLDDLFQLITRDVGELLVAVFSLSRATFSTGRGRFEKGLDWNAL